MTIQYKTKGVCSQQMNVKIEDGVVQKVEIVGGCHGNSQGVARLVEGMRAEDASRRSKASAAATRPPPVPTSCPSPPDRLGRGSKTEAMRGNPR